MTSMFRLLLPALLLATTLATTGCQPEVTGLKGVDLQAYARGREFHLVDTEGRPRSQRDFDGKALVLFFGFTHCPDVCPITLSRAVQIKRALGADAGRVQFAFATLDPARDTPQLLKDYTEAFDPDFVGLTGTEGEVAVAASNLGVVHKKVPMGESYTIDHSTRSFVFDGKGQLVVGLTHEQSVEDCVADIRKVLAAG